MVPALACLCLLGIQWMCCCMLHGLEGLCSLPPLPSEAHALPLPWQEEEGALGLWLTYLLAGVGGTVASYLTSPHTHTISLGASGAVFGLFMVGPQGADSLLPLWFMRHAAQPGMQAGQTATGMALPGSLLRERKGALLMLRTPPRATPIIWLPLRAPALPAGVRHSQVQAKFEAAARVCHPGAVCCAAGGAARGECEWEGQRHNGGSVNMIHSQHALCGVLEAMPVTQVCRLRQAAYSTGRQHRLMPPLQVLSEFQMATAGRGMTMGGMQVGHVAHLAGAAVGVLLVVLLSRLPEPADS